MIESDDLCDLSSHLADLRLEALRLINVLTEGRQTISTAESVTGGLIASTLVCVPGVSQFFRGGIVAYSTDLKKSLLGVTDEQLNHGVVSAEVACSMAVGARITLGSDLAIATTGVAGPGHSEGNVPGTVWLGFASKSLVVSTLLQLAGDRMQIRIAAAQQALSFARTQCQ